MNFRAFGLQIKKIKDFCEALDFRAFQLYIKYNGIYGIICLRAQESGNKNNQNESFQ